MHDSKIAKICSRRQLEIALKPLASIHQVVHRPKSIFLVVISYDSGSESVLNKQNY